MNPDDLDAAFAAWKARQGQGATTPPTAADLDTAFTQWKAGRGAGPPPTQAPDRTRVIAAGLVNSPIPGAGLIGAALNTKAGRRLFAGMADPRAALRAVDAAAFGIPRRLAAAMSPAGYTAGRAVQERDRAVYSQQYPETALAADLAGGLATAGPAGEVASAALRAIPAAGRAFRAAESGTGVVNALTRGAENVGIGALVGGAAGFGQARQGEEVGGALGGAVLGGAGAAIVGGGVGAVRGLRSLVAGRPAGEVIGNRIAASGETLDDVAARASAQVETGRSPKLIEVMDATGEDVAHMAGAQSEEAALLLRRAGDAMARNKTGIADQLGKDVGDVLGVSPKPIQGLLDDIERVRSAKAEEMYPLLHADTRPIKDKRLLTLMQGPSFQRAHAEALELATETARTAAVGGGSTPPAFTPILGADGRMVAWPNIATLDWIKQGADRLLRKAPTAGGLDKAMARQMRLQLRTLRRIGDEFNPDYGKVRKIQEALFTAQDVLKAGQALGRSGTTTPDKVLGEARKIAERHGMDALPVSFQRLLRIGAADGIAQRVAQSGVSPLTKASTLRQVAALGGDAEELVRRATMTLESQQATAAMVGAESRVAARTVGDIAAVSADLPTGNVTGGIRNFAKAQLVPRVRGLTPRNSPDVADLLNYDAPRAIAEIRQAGRSQVSSRLAASEAQRKLVSQIARLLTGSVSP